MSIKPEDIGSKKLSPDELNLKSFVSDSKWVIVDPKNPRGNGDYLDHFNLNSLKGEGKFDLSSSVYRLDLPKGGESGHDLDSLREVAEKHGFKGGENCNILDGVIDDKDLERVYIPSAFMDDLKANLGCAESKAASKG